MHVQLCESAVRSHQEQAVTTLNADEDTRRKLMARVGGSSPYRCAQAAARWSTHGK